MLAMRENHTADLFEQPAGTHPQCLTDAAVDQALALDAAVAIGVSGGKDSQACTIAVMRHLDAIGHKGPRVLVHADLGMVEWDASLPGCKTLADHYGLELIVVRRAAGGLMERWESRWQSSVRRYAEMETVTLVMPWSSSALRFCTSELKTQVITPELRRRFKNRPIINVTGQRRQESIARAKLSISAYDLRASRPGSPMLNWRPILDWRIEEVFSEISAAGLALHEAYTTWNTSRVSCRFCVMSSRPDLAAASQDPASIPLYRRMVRLECDSSFAFQSGKWLADVRPEHLDEESISRVAMAKQAAARRQAAEAVLPKDLRYVDGWPTFVPTMEEAALVAEMRREVAAAVNLDIRYTTAAQVQDRYRDLFALRAA